ncbi:superoxide dismutase [Cu-Zn] SodC [Malonomonas rubra]|uniref:superoxide dismutase [Cu-Zn] SodC n=1 Tax=Malonomonas rubra TaxID=57040 RepID=UPI0026EA71D8|nr:superoxide dismutase [Cu-Zn] SodC [Malonomonas rubra]
MFKIQYFVWILLLLPVSVTAATLVPMKLIDANGTVADAGIIEVSQTEYGLVFTPNLQGLTSGLHGFHLHQNSDCAPAEKNGQLVAGLSAGGHYDPAETGKHGSPWGDGHLGDLPALYVDEQGRAKEPVLAPRLKMSDIENRSLMIHADGDNFSDLPKKLGGGGARIACGVIP